MNITTGLRVDVPIGPEHVQAPAPQPSAPTAELAPGHVAMGRDSVTVGARTVLPFGHRRERFPI